MKKRFRAAAVLLVLTMILGMMTGCGASSESEKKIIRIGHNVLLPFYESKSPTEFHEELLKVVN